MTQPSQTCPPTTDSAPGDSLGSGAAGITLVHVEQAHVDTGAWGAAHA